MRKRPRPPEASTTMEERPSGPVEDRPPRRRRVADEATTMQRRPADERTRAPQPTERVRAPAPDPGGASEAPTAVRRKRSRPDDQTLPPTVAGVADEEATLPPTDLDVSRDEAATRPPTAGIARDEVPTRPPTGPVGTNDEATMPPTAVAGPPTGAVEDATVPPTALEPGSAPPPRTQSPDDTMPPTRGPDHATSAPAPTPRADQPADITLHIPGYRLLKRLGAGGMGEVYLADRASETGVALRCVLKTVLPKLQGEQNFEALFLDEARIIASLHHPNITGVIDVGRGGGVLYMAMEWIDGLDAAGLGRQDEIPLVNVLYVVKETLQGLHHAHTAMDHDGNPLNLVHRDISPGNILISRQGAVKLADFGVAMATVAKVNQSPDVLVGKLHYFAPEVIGGAPPSVQSDIFALGVTFYEILTGKAVFSRRKSTREVLLEVKHFDENKLIESNLTLPDGLEPILLRALAADPDRRYATALEFLEDINDFAYETGLRLLDAHFADYIRRILGSGGKPRRRMLRRPDAKG